MMTMMTTTIISGRGAPPLWLPVVASRRTWCISVFTVAPLSFSRAVCRRAASSVAVVVVVNRENKVVQRQLDAVRRLGAVARKQKRQFIKILLKLDVALAFAATEQKIEVRKSEWEDRGGAAKSCRCKRGCESERFSQEVRRVVAD